MAVTRPRREPAPPAPPAVEVAEQLRRLLAVVEAGELDATTEERARIEGAVVALDVTSGRAPGTSTTT